MGGRIPKNCVICGKKFAGTGCQLSCSRACAAERHRRVIMAMNASRREQRAKGRKRCPHCGNLLPKEPRPGPSN